jgi:tRNA (adenine57-N1/adenine58-N1)-methyltransferase
MPLNYGDDVVIMLDDGSTYLIKLSENSQLGTHKGNIKHSELLSKDFGDVFELNGTLVYILEPTIVDYIFKMKRRTQIVYPKDSGFVLLMLDIKEGDRVIDAGVGSGAMCGLLARYVGNTGKVFAYEKREDFIELAKKNLERWGLLNRVEFRHRDISEGFDEENVDAFFLDVPDPIPHIENVWKVLKGSGRLAVLCPTTNQVQDVIKKMQQTGFARIEVWENLFRQYKPNPKRLRPFDRMVAHTAYLVFGIKINQEEKGVDSK